MITNTTTGQPTDTYNIPPSANFKTVQFRKIKERIKQLFGGNCYSKTRIDDNRPYTEIKVL